MTSPLFDLSGKVAIVTGGNGGIGLGMARGLAEAGADIAIVGRNEAKSDAAVADIKQRGAKAISVIAADIPPTKKPRTVPGLSCLLRFRGSQYLATSGPLNL